MAGDTEKVRRVLSIHEEFSNMLHTDNFQNEMKHNALTHGKALGILSVLVALEDALGVDCVGKPVDRPYRDGLKW